MPVPNRQSIGFYEGGLDRLKALCEVTDTTQRDLIASFLALPDSKVKEIVDQWKASSFNVKKKRSEIVSVLKSSQLSKEQLESISKIIGGSNV